MVRPDIADLTTVNTLRKYVDRYGLMDGTLDSVKTNRRLKIFTKEDCKCMYYLIYGGFPLPNMRKIDILLEIRRFFERYDK